MWLLLVPVCLAIFSQSLTSASEPHYVITVPANLEQGTEEKACVTFLDLKGPVDFKIELKHDDHVYIVTEHKLTTDDHSACYTFQVPEIKEDRAVWLLHVSAHGEHMNVDESKKVAIIKRHDMCVIHSDKSTYKPGDIVTFRLMSVNNDMKPLSKKHHLIELTDPNKNRIAQWRDVSTKQGFADLTFHLADELALGDYKIDIPGSCSKYFTVEEYVIKRFQFDLNIPSDVALTDETFHLEACGKYSFGEPVEGAMDLSVCASHCHHRWLCHSHSSSEEETDDRKCIDIKGEKPNSKGCLSKDFQLGYFNLTSTEDFLEIKSKLTEDHTGHSEESSGNLYLKTAKKTVKFVDCKIVFHKGFPYHGKVNVSDEKGQPIVNEALTLYIIKDENLSNVTRVNLVTDSHGIAHFTLKTSEWPTFAVLKVHFSSDVKDDDDDEDVSAFFHEERYPTDLLWLVAFYSESESLLSIQKQPNDISCNSEQSVTVEYNIHKKNLDADTNHLHFFYIILTKSGIFSYKEHKVDIKDPGNSPNLQGSFPLNFHVDKDFFPTYDLIVFSVLPNGKTVAWFTEYKVLPPEDRKVKLTFSEEKVEPGDHVNLEVTADPGSLCSVRSVDKGYLLKYPHADSFMLTDLTEGLRSNIQSFPFAYMLIGRDEDQCPDNTRPRNEEVFDVHNLFLMNGLQIFTNTEIKKPLNCESPELAARSAIKKKKAERKDKKHFTRSDFSDTWLFELVHVGSDGHTLLNRTTPHSITKWVTDAFCLGTSGFASVRDVELSIFQPYFIDLIVPHSVVQGEKFKMQVLVFSYVNKCNLIVVSLADSEDLITIQKKEQAKCVCDGHSHSFTWDVSTLKPKTLNIHVDSGSLEVEGECTQDALLIGKDHRKDSVEKNIVVKPRGYEDEKTKTFLLFPSDNRELTINVDAPERLVPGSERAHIIVLGDLMANFILNMDDILFMPDGCGEQNMAKFARYVYALDYLESIEGVTPESKAKALEHIIEGYQRHLTFRNENGSYTLFPNERENIWLTAFTVKVYNGARKFIYIDESHIQQAVNWLQSKQQTDGCFKEEGDYFNNELEADNDVTRTAYITVALLEHHIVYNGSIVENALSFLRKSADSVTSVYTQALLAYACTLSGDSELRDQMLKKLDESAVRKEGSKHWTTHSYREGEIETASYVILALLSEKTTTIKNLEDSGDIIRWIVTQQNPWGGFYSSQDTTIALQALAKYAKAISHKKEDSTVTIKSKSGFEKTIHVNKSNSLLVQIVDLPDCPGEYTLSAIGDGFVYAQLHLHHHVFPEETEKGYFSFNISTEPSICTHASHKKFDVHMDVRYLGKRENTNMALIILENLSGFVAEKNSMKKLKENPLVERTEVTPHNITIYLAKLTHETVSLVFSVEKEALVQNLQPANAVVFDYYDPDEHSVVQYNAPCHSVVAHCAVAGAEREDCGYENISREKCEQKGCCFDSSIPGTKWCFFHGFQKTENH